ncbi:MAG: sulfatase, partial [Phascolarctobacterium sp.]|nr:sulfatase [Phascolarctobacterium sp.]
MKVFLEKHIVPIFIVLVLAIEGYIASLYYIGADPYPYEDFYFRMISCSLRDMVFGAIAGVLYYRRKRIPDRTRRYFPVVVIGFMHIAACVFMINQLSLDWSVQTVLAILAGINNNILMVLLAAICYHKWPTISMKIVYFATYLYTAATIIFDMFYFWQTGMHVESVLFQNLNIYAVKGVLATTSNQIIIGVCVAFLVIILLFRIESPKKRKPNFAWSLLCVAAFTIGMNLADRVLGALGMYAVENVIGAYIEIENEKTRVLYRDSLSMPINLNFIGKALFDTDKMASRGHVEQRELTEKDKKSLAELGIVFPKPAIKKITAQYDKVVMLILESVHRDYINYFNKNIPEKATPYLNSLIIKQPHMDRFYSSAIPTTQGLNAIFRSHLIMDKDVPGRINPSLFKSVQDAGYRGIFMNASSHYYANELREYPDQFGMKEYYAREHLEKLGYTGASGWGFHNDVMYEETLKLLEKGKNDKMFLVTKTLDM